MPLVKEVRLGGEVTVWVGAVREVWVSSGAEYRVSMRTETECRYPLSRQFPCTGGDRAVRMLLSPSLS